MPTPEGKVKARVKEILHKFGLMAAGQPEHLRPTYVRGWYYMPVQNGMGVTGIPDFIGCFLGSFFAIETKAPSNKDNLTANQRDRLTEIAMAHGDVFVADDPEEFYDDFRMFVAYHER